MTNYPTTRMFSYTIHTPAYYTFAITDRQTVTGIRVLTNDWKEVKLELEMAGLDVLNVVKG